MQTDYKQIYKELAEKTGKSEQLYKDIGNFIFAETYRMMRKPSSLILKLKGIGSWYLRKKRMDIVVTEWGDRGLVRTREEFDTDSGYEKYLEKKAQYDNFVERLKEYDEYLALRDEIRAIRRKTQYPLKRNEDED